MGWVCLTAAAVGLAGGLMLLADDGRQPEPGVGGDRLKPQWQPGDRWVVEARARMNQFREDPDGREQASVPWEFTVKQTEKVGGHDCFRVEARCLLPGPPQPASTLWADAHSLALRQVRTQLPVLGGFRTVTESYQFADGQPAPVLGPLTALPIDLPLFAAAGATGPQSFEYEALSGPAGVKADVGDVGFAVAVEQSLVPANPAEVTGLLPGPFAKGLGDGPMVEVRLKTSDRLVRQLWQPSKPWPVYADNGSTVARLVQVIPARTGK
jgi:hypothetical protein